MFSVLDIICIVIGVAGMIWCVKGTIESIKEKNFGLDILAIMAILATLLVGEYVASVIVVVMSITGELLESYAGKRAEKELDSLVSKTPNLAHLFNSDLKSTCDIDVNDISPGDILYVLNGELVPVDGILLDDASLDQSSLTGESLPINKTTGESVMSGTIAGNAFKIKAISDAKNSSYQKITELVALAKEQKSPVVRLANKVSIPFTIISLFIAFLSWFISGEAIRFAEVLVLATPCPLLIAAPVAFLAGLSRAAKSGIIIKGGGTLEQLNNVKIVAFDKTGTITQGKPLFDRIEITQIGQEEGWNEEKVLNYAASLEVFSNHILASAIVQANKLPLLQVENHRDNVGTGVSGDINNERIVLMKPPHELAINPGETVVELQVLGKDIAHIILVDHMRDDAPQTIENIRKLGINQLLVLTGDKQETAKYIASKTGITEVFSSLLPHQKYEIINNLKKSCIFSKNCSQLPENDSVNSKRKVAMVGDGVNDAPVLMASDVGIALGAGGSGVATESADVVILEDKFILVSESILIGKQTMKIAKQSTIGGITLSIILMIIASFGFIPAVIGATLQEVIDVLAICNGIRAKGGKSFLKSNRK